MKCVETDDEPITNSTETFYQLSCFIDKGKADLNYILTDIQILFISVNCLVIFPAHVPVFFGVAGKILEMLS